MSSAFIPEQIEVYTGEISLSNRMVRNSQAESMFTNRYLRTDFKHVLHFYHTIFSSYTFFFLESLLCLADYVFSNLVIHVLIAA